MSIRGDAMKRDFELGLEDMKVEWNTLPPHMITEAVSDCVRTLMLTESALDHRNQVDESMVVGPIFEEFIYNDPHERERVRGLHQKAIDRASSPGVTLLVLYLPVDALMAMHIIAFSQKCSWRRIAMLHGLAAQERSFSRVDPELAAVIRAGSKKPKVVLFVGGR